MSRHAMILLAAFVALAWAHPTMGPCDAQFLIDTNTTGNPGRDRQDEPSVAFDGTNFMVVWTDYRNGTTGGIYGTRVTPDGAVLDPLGIPISPEASYQPSVAFDGTNFLVVWTEYGSDTAYVRGARVAPTGIVLDTTDIIFGHVIGGGTFSPVAAFDGTGYLVVWEADLWTDAVCGARVNTSGVLLDSSGIWISDSAGQPAIGFDGTNFLVTWEKLDSGWVFPRSIRGTRVTPAGVVLDVPAITVSDAGSYRYASALAYDGTTYLAVWTDLREGNGDIYGTRLTPHGVVLDTTGLAISTPASDQQSLAVCFEGTDFLVAWQDNRNASSDIYGARVAQTGVVVDSGPIVHQDSDHVAAKLCYGNGKVLLVYRGWTGTVRGKTYNTNRIWGMFNPLPGVAESPRHDSQFTRFVASIIRGTLELSPQLTANSSRLGLYDANGRKVMDIPHSAFRTPHSVDVSRLAPGIYFLRLSAGGQTVNQKIVIAR